MFTKFKAWIAGISGVAIIGGLLAVFSFGKRSERNRNQLDDKNRAIKRYQKENVKRALTQEEYDELYRNN